METYRGFWRRFLFGGHDFRFFLWTRFAVFAETARGLRQRCVIRNEQWQFLKMVLWKRIPVGGNELWFLGATFVLWTRLTVFADTISGFCGHDLRFLWKRFADYGNDVRLVKTVCGF